MLYLKIENPGVPPLEALTILGVSTTRYDSTSETIGEFGSGCKNAVACLLRHDIQPTMFLGKLRLDFYAEPQLISDDLTSHTYHRVIAKLRGKDPSGRSRSGSEKLGFTTEMGVKDWPEAAMGIREFVSNAIDRSIRQEQDYRQAKIEVVDDGQVRAKDGCTRVFLPLQNEVKEFYESLPKRFLHFSSDSLNQKILPKRGRNLVEGRNVPMVYKKGVFVREVLRHDYDRNPIPSIYDYNLGEELRLDESRNVEDWAVKHAVEAVIRNAEPPILAEIFRQLIKGENVWEATLDPYDTIYGEEARKRISDNWQEAWRLAAGDSILVTVDLDFTKERVQRAGYNATVMSYPKWATACEKYGIKSDLSILGEEARQGRDILEPTPDVVKSLDWFWGYVQRFGLTEGKDKPLAKCFTEVLKAGEQRLGYYRDGTCFIHTDLSQGESDLLRKVMAEEATHYATNGASDMSRDLQDYAFRMLVMALRALDEAEGKT